MKLQRIEDRVRNRITADYPLLVKAWQEGRFIPVRQMKGIAEVYDLFLRKEGFNGIGNGESAYT